MSIGFIGVGKLGLSLALIFEENGHNIVCFDKNESQRNNIRDKSLKTIEPHVEDMLVKSKNISVVDSYKEIYNLPTNCVIVLTPSLPNGAYDHSAVDDVVNNLLLENEKNPDYSDKLLVIVCTVMPLYTQSIQEKLAKYNYHVCYSPEFIVQGNIVNGMKSPDLVLVGYTSEWAKEKITSLHNSYLINKPEFAYMSLTDAEITKISINCFLTTKISFANTIGDIVNKTGGNPQVVLSAIGADSRIGKKFLRWGHGFGGPCLPRDNKALCYFSNKVGIKNKIGEASDAINIDHLQNLVEYILLENKENKPFFFDSVVYKKNTTILEESQQLELAKEIQKRGMKVYIHDSENVLKSLECLFGEKFNYIYKLTNDEDKKFFVVNNHIN
jgi:nucleotide sugar dehydrogenase